MRRSAPALKQRPEIQPTTGGDYSAFAQLDGSHPLLESVPEFRVLYPARILPRARVVYFNFALAKEMGLIASDHPERLNSKLNEVLVETFALRIVNEWDVAHEVQIPRALLKPKPYMATRYLQMQHSDKNGRTSGDGRSIWNGRVVHRGRTWDVSSRGTGVTCLAPGAARSGKPLRSGSGEVSYGCGMAELDELYAGAIQSEIFYHRGISTERTLVILDVGRGLGIGVRAAPNLLRPAHLFLHVRQHRQKPLRRLLKSYCESQAIPPSKFLNQFCDRFARFAARLEREHIFTWMEWDGDNVLLDGGIIDYGSVRQFGIRHDQYRYDDIERFSTNLNEQRAKARLIVLSMAQAVQYALTGVRRRRDAFVRQALRRRFDRIFQEQLALTAFAQAGVDESVAQELVQHRSKFSQQFIKSLQALEKVYSRRAERLPDGVNRPALTNVRRLLRELPRAAAAVSRIDIHTLRFAARELIWASHASPAQRRRCQRLVHRRLDQFLHQYLKLLRHVTGLEDGPGTLREMRRRLERREHDLVLTGNALILITEALMSARRRGLSDERIQQLMQTLIATQAPHARKLYSLPNDPLWMTMLTILKEHSEDI